jgi:3-carboxy-cis,cis-muconate cycloisomerase
MLERLAALARKSATMAMPGRTWLQHATPVSVGLKAAGWLDALLDIKERLIKIDAHLPLQFGGASGTLAALGLKGDQVSDALAARLKLRRAILPWHAARIPVVELAACVGMLIGVLGKAARDIALLMQTEIGEMSEASAPGRGGSSTMAHKRNPVGCAIALAAAQRGPGLVATMMSAMVQEQERGLGGWQAEWNVLPELMLVASGASHAMRGVLGGLVIDEQRIAANLNLDAGLPMAEAASFALAEVFGRLEAKRLIAEAIARVRASPGMSLKQALLSLDEVKDRLGEAAVSEMLAPSHYLGSSAAMIERVLRRYHEGPGSI